MNLTDGSYTVTPSLSGYTFSPPSRDVTVSGSDVSGCDFTAASSGGKIYPDVTVGSTFTYTSIAQINKKPIIYAVVRGRDTPVNVTNRSFPRTTVNCQWTAKCAAGTYGLWMNGTVDGQKVNQQIRTVTVMPPSIENLSTETLTPGTRVTATGTYFSARPMVNTPAAARH